ncbi:hypothetical protein M0M57_10630 [Flavobacterium azooxidireducens]|uniref:Lipoprotein n=1 Tax=Flavobacterium azooxidireducens TaxID=1871076 RepID=A0ABY4KB98_9FLAO|nr:hypothetical protein [Flavobacterium azooxidireducens]UPQ78077.1 hypothetical protein M0M57_10630 [Flavobacterium azooxidireducens]
MNFKKHFILLAITVVSISCSVHKNRPVVDFIKKEENTDFIIIDKTIAPDNKTVIDRLQKYGSLQKTNGTYPYLGSIFLEKDDIDWLYKKYANERIDKVWSKKDFKKLDFSMVDFTEISKSNTVRNYTSESQIAYSYIISKPLYTEKCDIVIFYIGKFRTHLTTNTFIYGEVVVMKKNKDKWSIMERLTMDIY